MFYDFIEIGTSDFDTLIEQADDQTVGLSVEPIAAYLDRLPRPKLCTKLNAAISNQDGEVVVFYLSPEKIFEYGLPAGFKGCNSIGKPHPTVASFLALTTLDQKVIFDTINIPAYRLRSVLALHNVSGMYFLKVDTEGHDVTILNDFFSDAPRAVWPHEILFESNILSDNDSLQLLIAKLITIGYDIKSCNTVGDGDTSLRLNIRRAQGGVTFSNEIEGYYLMGYPDGYDPSLAAHDNTLIGAKEYCVNTKSGGVTYQYGRYEVRKGQYLEKSRDDRNVISWIYF